MLHTNISIFTAITSDEQYFLNEKAVEVTKFIYTISCEILAHNMNSCEISSEVVRMQGNSN